MALPEPHVPATRAEAERGLRGLAPPRLLRHRHRRHRSGAAPAGDVQSAYTRLTFARWPPSVSAVAVTRAPVSGTRTVALAARGTPVSRAISRPSTRTRTPPRIAPSGGVTRTVTLRRASHADEVAERCSTAASPSVGSCSV